MSAAAEDHYEGTTINGGLTIFQQFESELEKRADSIASMLPSTVTLARFTNTVNAAIRQDPSILAATIRSVMAAVIRAAQDGLVPDGREGHIAVYNVNVAKKGEKDRWEKRAQWNAMAFGLRKRLRELDGIIANAEVVHECDKFVWHQGDDPRIEHEPACLGTDRGKMIGAYCIYKREDGTILHREVMDFTQIERTRDQSKAKDSLMWTKFASEGYRKSVLRRGVKTVPVSDQMREIIQRDDEDNFDFRERTTADVTTLVPPTPPPAPEPPAITHREPEQTLPPMPEREPEAALVPEPKKRGRKAKEADTSPPAEPTKAYEDLISELYDELAACESDKAVEDIRERGAAQLKPDHVQAWKDACADRSTELFNAQ